MKYPTLEFESTSQISEFVFWDRECKPRAHNKYEPLINTITNKGW